MRAETELAGEHVTLVYRVAAHGHGPVALNLNGAPLDFQRLDNPYRDGAAAVSMRSIAERLTGGENVLEVELS
jgi:hypothetical protein